jgi:cytochrome c oxidase cbb3-type subunit 3
MIRPVLFALAALTLVALGACGRARGGSATAVDPVEVPGDQAMARIPLGPPPGQPTSPATRVENPYEGDVVAIQQGKALFGAMNCVYCHGAQGSGLIGPPLDGAGWRYGGAPAQIYNSIHDGRPKGMPAWGDRLPPEQIWKLTAYVESLGGATAPATARMRTLGGAQPSTTGAEPADQVQTDTAHQALVAGDHRPGN